MKKMALTLLCFLLIPSMASALSLLQEEKEIICSDSGTEVLIDKKDKYFIVDGKTYRLTEFLDSAILAEANPGEFALIQLTPKETASLVTGTLKRFVETHPFNGCRQVQATKVCQQNGNDYLNWSSTSLGVLGQSFPVVHYGVYPNDGTYFLAYENDSAIALIDFGSKFSVLHGEHKKLNCRYK